MPADRNGVPIGMRTSDFILQQPTFGNSSDATGRRNRASYSSGGAHSVKPRLVWRGCYRFHSQLPQPFLTALDLRQKPILVSDGADCWCPFQDNTLHPQRLFSCSHIGLHNALMHEHSNKNNAAGSNDAVVHIGGCSAGKGSVGTPVSAANGCDSSRRTRTATIESSGFG
eukprot:COSAG02_NODE_8168_length_2680_cov_1.244091_2_plen_170_part_00